MNGPWELGKGRTASLLREAFLRAKDSASDPVKAWSWVHEALLPAWPGGPMREARPRGPRAAPHWLPAPLCSTLLQIQGPPRQALHRPPQSSPQSEKERAGGEGHVSVQDPLLFPGLCASPPRRRLQAG